MNRTKRELVVVLVLFVSSHTFALAMALETAKIYRRISEQGVEVRILVPKELGDNKNSSFAELRSIAPLVQLKLSDTNLKTNITIMVSDRKEFMSLDLKDDPLNDPYEDGGVATYSNIQSIAASCATIFDNLWKISELAENLRAAHCLAFRNAQKVRRTQ